MQWCDGSPERPRRPPRWAMGSSWAASLARFSGSVRTQLPNDDCCQGQHCPDTCRSGVGPPILFRIHGARLALAPLHEAVDVGYPGPDDDDLVAGFRRSAADAFRRTAAPRLVKPRAQLHDQRRVRLSLMVGLERGATAPCLWSECGRRVLTAERTVDPARMFTESLTPRPELENSQGQTRSLSGDPAYQKTRHDMEES